MTQLEPNKLGSSITPHFKGKRLYFIIKKFTKSLSPNFANVSINLYLEKKNISADCQQRYEK